MAAVACSRVSAMTDALAGGEPVGLHHHGQGLLGDIGERAFGILAALVGGGRNTELGTEILGETFRPLQPRRCFGRPEHFDLCGGEIVGEASHQRPLRPHHHEADVVVDAELDDGGMVVDVDVGDLGDLGNAGVAGRAVDAAEQGACRNRPGQGVLAAAGAD